MELESVGDAALITSEEQSSITLRDSTYYLSCCQLGSKLNTMSHDSTGFNRNRRSPWGGFKVVSRIGFPNVRSKWTTQLGAYLAFESEVIVPVQQTKPSARILCMQDDAVTFLGLLLNLGRLGRGLCQ